MFLSNKDIKFYQILVLVFLIPILSGLLQGNANRDIDNNNAYILLVQDDASECNIENFSLDFGKVLIDINFFSNKPLFAQNFKKNHHSDGVLHGLFNLLFSNPFIFDLPPPLDNQNISTFI